MKKFERPATLIYPTTYYKFKALDCDNSTIAEYRIQDFPQDRHDDGIKFMLEYFASGEPTFRARDISTDKLAVIEGSRIWREILSQNISIACFKEGSDDIVSMNLLTVKTIFDDDSEENEEDRPRIKSQNLKDIINLHNLLDKKFNTFKHYNVDAYLYAFGLAVHPDYRGKGIATEMFKVRPKLLKALGLKVTTSHFFGTIAQYAAAKACYEENLVLSYDDLYKINTNFYFSGVENSNVKVMSLSLV